MAPKGGHINFMFLGLPYPAAGSATVGPHDQEEIVSSSYLFELLLSANDTATHQDNHTLSSLPRLPQNAVLNNHSVSGG